MQMIKNILIVILIAVVAFLYVSQERGSDFTPQSSTEVVSEQVSQEDTEDTEDNRGGNLLDLSGQGLEKLPSYVLSNTSLEELDISNNNLTGALPAEIRHLRNLRVLKANNNEMTGVPAEVGQLENLEILDLSNNQLTGLPYEMGNLKRLKTLNLSGNDYAEQDLEIIKKGLSPDTEIIL